MLLRPAILLLIILISTAAATQDQISGQLESLVQQYHANHDFSGTVLVARKGEILYQGSMGFANATEHVLNTIDTKFLVGSTTKSFTALTCMQFVERNLVKLNVPISTYLPELKPQLGKLTLHHLLKMQSGLPNHMARLTDIEARDITVDEMLEIINTAELAYKPGTQYSYSNINYHLVASVLIKASGKSFAEILNNYVFDPIRMENSGVERLSHVPEGRALGYDARSKGSLVESYPNYTAWALGSGDIYSTVGDLYQWDQALYKNSYLSADSKVLAFDGATEEFGNYGYGFRIVDYKRTDDQIDPGTLVRHGGSMYGYLANVHRYLDDEITVIVLANVRPFPIRDMTFQLKEIVLGRTPGSRDFE